MIRKHILQIPRRSIVFDFFKKKKEGTAQQRLQEDFQKFKNDPSFKSTQPKGPAINYKFTSETLAKLKGFLGTAKYESKASAVLTNDLLKQIIMCHGFQSLMVVQSESASLIEKLVEYIWEGVEQFDDSEPMINLFWLAVHSNFFTQKIGYNDYLMFFNLNSGRLSMKEAVTVINIILIHQRIKRQKKVVGLQSPIDDGAERTQPQFKDLLEEEQQVIEKVSQNCLRNLQHGTEDFYSLTEINNLLKSTGFPENEFYELAEKLIKDHLLPFNSQRMLAYLNYQASREKYSLDKSHKLEAFRHAAEFLGENLASCSFDELFMFGMLYIKEVGISSDVSAKTLIENIFNQILTREDLKLETTKLLDLLELAKDKISIKFFLRGLRKTETHIMYEMKDVSPEQFAQFTFLAQNYNYSYVYKADFEKKMFGFAHVFTLDDLLKVTWANEYGFQNDDFKRKTIEILTPKIQEITQNPDILVPPVKIMPFIWFLNYKMPKATIELYEKYIQNGIGRFDLHDIAIILWSVVRKTKVTVKTVYCILERYYDLLGALSKGECEEEISARKKSTVSETGCWEVMTILWGFTSFQFDPDGKRIADILQISIPLVQKLIDEFSKDEILMIAKVYFTARPHFDKLYEDNQSFVSDLLGQLEAYLELFDLKELIIVCHLLTNNQLLLNKHENLAVKFIEHKRELESAKRTSPSNEASEETDKELEERFKQHF